MLLDPQIKKKVSIARAIEIYNSVKLLNKPNMIGARIPLHHGLNMLKWRQYLKNYEDEKLVDFLELSWPINYVQSAPPSPSSQNHQSALSHRDDVDAYINNEIDAGAMLGPFSDPPFVPWFQTSPLMTRVKKSSTSRRIIADFSWPIGKSVNSGIPTDTYMGSPYKLHLPSPDDFVSLIRKHDTGCYIFSLDLARAYRQLRVDPLDWPLLGLKMDNNFFADMAVPFGIRWAAMFCQRTTNAVSYIATQRGDVLLPYIDDITGITHSKPAANKSFHRTRQLFNELGLEEAHHKACTPSTNMTWIGLEFDTHIRHAKWLERT